MYLLYWIRAFHIKMHSELVPTARRSGSFCILSCQSVHVCSLVLHTSLSHTNKHTHAHVCSLLRAAVHNLERFIDCILLLSGVQQREYVITTVGRTQLFQNMHITCMCYIISTHMLLYFMSAPFSTVLASSASCSRILCTSARAEVAPTQQTTPPPPHVLCAHTYNHHM